VAVYRCRVTSNGTHFDSHDPGCEGQTGEGLLGYLLGDGSFDVVAYRAPAVVTTPATGATPISVDVHGSVDPEGELVSECRFEYGLTSSYGASVACVALPGEGESPVAVSAAIVGLTPKTVYHFRIVARNATGTSYGGDQTFTTLPLTAPEPTTRGPSQNGGATSGPTPSHSVLAGKTRRSASLLSRALAKCRKIKNRHKRARCIARARKHYGTGHSRLGGRAKGRR
jgi:hypothetical protein